MPALMAQRSSATRNQIIRELERRRKSVNVANGRVMKKQSSAAPALPPRLIPSVALKLANAPREGVAKKGSASLPLTGVLIPTGAPGAARKKVTYLDLGEAPKRPTLPQRSREALIPFALKAPKPTAFIPHAPAAATKLSATTSHEDEKTGAETRYIKKASSTPIQPLPSSSILVKKGSASLPLTGVLIPTGAPGAARKKITYLDLGDAPERPTLPQRSREAMKAPKPTAFIPHAPTAAMKLSATATTSQEHEKTGAETRYINKPSSTPIQPLHSSSILVKKGMTVKMRTPAGTLPTGERLVILNHAVVVSDVSEDGYVEVVYKGNSHYPPMRISLDQVKIMPPTK